MTKKVFANDLNTNIIIADSSFFIFFLNDIDSPSYLERIVNRYRFILTPRIKEEIICKEENRNWLDKNRELFDDAPFLEGAYLEKIFSPFISDKEELYKKGEYEIIGLAYLLKDNTDFLLLIDDKDARRLINSFIPDLKGYLCYTTQFIEICACNTHVLDKREALEIIKKMRETRRFRITESKLTEIEENIKRW